MNHAVSKKVELMFVMSAAERPVIYLTDNKICDVEKKPMRNDLRSAPGGLRAMQRGSIQNLKKGLTAIHSKHWQLINL